MEFNGLRTAAIIGAGVSGLVSARMLAAEGLDCTLIERSAMLGGVWADGYCSFGVQVQKELYEIPDWPLPEDTSDFTPGPIFQRYLEDYADHFELRQRIRFETSLEAMAPRGDGRAGWTLTLRHGEVTREEGFDLVVVCVGLYSSQPHMPTFPGAEKFGGEVMHVSGFKSRDQIAGKRVAVLGYGKSATDTALESAAVAEETHAIFREAHWPVPRRLAGILPFKWGMLNRMTSTLIPLYQRPSAFERAVHGVGKPLVWLWWRLVEILLYFQARLGSRFGTRVSLVPREPVEVDCFGESTMLPRPDLYRLIRQGRIAAHRTRIAGYTENGIALENGENLDIDVLILATGWRTDYGFLPVALRDAAASDEDGFYLYRHILHPAAANLAFIGRASTISSILTYCLQARWLAELVAGRHVLPDEAAMAREIEDMKAWKRAWMPFSEARGARLLLHMQHYHDELLEDFRADPLRKTGIWAPLKEMIEPYQARDYRTIVSGEWNRPEGST